MAGDSGMILTMNRLPYAFLFTTLIFCTFSPPVQAQESAVGFIATIFQDDVAITANNIDAASSSYPMEMGAFYARRNFKPFWHNKKGILENRGEVLEQKLKNSWTHGLNPKTYNVERIEVLRRAGKVGELDAVLTDGFIKYVRDLSGARVNPVKLGLNPEDWLLSYPPHEVVKFLETLKDFNDFEAEILPQSETYKRLQEELVKLIREEEKNPEDAYPEIKFKNKFTEPGQRDPGVPALRHRMGLSPFPPASETRYDDALAASVMRFQRDHGLKVDGILGEETLHMLTHGRRDKIRQIIANLERLRWAPHERPARYVVVNVPSAKLWAIEDNKIALEMEVLVGKPDRPTQSFVAKITGVRFNPDWTVPPTIKKQDILPAAIADPGYFSKKGIEIYDEDEKGVYRVDPKSVPWKNLKSSELSRLQMVQPPGSYNPLGSFRILMPNKYNIYLHDTNEKYKFDRAKRALSSGCVRMSKPREMAEFILKDKKGWSDSRMEPILQSGKRTDVMIDETMPVYIFYYTAWIDPDGRLIFGRDLYNYDKKLMDFLAAVDGYFIPSHNETAL